MSDQTNEPAREYKSDAQYAEQAHEGFCRSLSEVRRMYSDEYSRNPLDRWPYPNGEYGMPSYDEVHSTTSLPSKEHVASRVAHLFDDGIRAMIASGELIVKKTATRVQVPFISREGSTVTGCSICAQALSNMDNFCPGCGAKIIEG